MQSIKHDLENNGYLVIPNILNSHEIKEYRHEFNKWIKTIDNLDTFHSLINSNGIFKYHEVGHQRFAWLLRTNPKIIDIFKLIWDTDSLVTSFDGCCYYPTNYNGTPSCWTHSDQSSIKKGRHCIQSFVSLTSNTERTFIVYEGSHKLHEEHSKTYNIEDPSDWYMINQDYLETIYHKKKILDISAGSLVLWDSRTFHQNTCGEPDCKEERLVQYLCYLPKNNIINDKLMQTKREYYFNTLRTTNHYPYPMTPVSLQSKLYNYNNNSDIYIDYNSLSTPYLDDLLDKIEHLL